MSIVAKDVFAERIEWYIEQNPDASAPEVMGAFLVEPTDEHREFVESMLDGEGSESPPSRPRRGSDGAGGVA